jgi:hypothetical protein
MANKPDHPLADAIESFMTSLGLGGGPRYGTPEWNASVEEGDRREKERRRKYLVEHPDAPRFPDE